MKAEFKRLVSDNEGSFIVVTQTTLENGRIYEGTLRGQFTEQQLVTDIGMTVQQVGDLLNK